MSARLIPTFGSLMRSACLQAAAPVDGIIGGWCAGLRGGALLASLPAKADAAVACVDALLPAMGHALAQAGERPPLRLRGKAAR